MNDDCNIFCWHKSAWGRYTSPDPIGFGGRFNLYRYCAK